MGVDGGRDRERLGGGVSDEGNDLWWNVGGGCIDKRVEVVVEGIE